VDFDNVSVSCAEGYRGPLCGLCAAGTATTWNSNECAPCGNLGVAWLKTILLAVFIFGVLFFLISRVLKRRTPDSTTNSREVVVSLKLIFTYLQVLNCLCACVLEAAQR
jgi:hypothetical protein